MEANITDQFLSELQDFCEMNLVYLMDDGLQVSCDKHPVSSEDMSTTYLSCITLRYPLDAGTFELLVQKDWNSVKDTIIPFFTRLASQYNVIMFDRLPYVFAGASNNSLAKTASLLGKVNNGQVQFNLRRTNVEKLGLYRGLSDGGFRKNFTVDDVISDRLDLGNNLIVEIRFYVSCNDDVLLPVKKSIGSRVKKFLGFNESDFYVKLKGDDLQVELDDICEPFLVPLVDDGFTYEVRPAWNGEFDIRLSFTDGGRTNKLYDYSLVMDRFIPLVRVLSRRYDLHDTVYFNGTEEFFTVDQILNGESPDFLVTTVKLTVKGKLQKVVESRKSTTDELKEFSENCLAYLLDDGFEIATYTMVHRSAAIWIDKPGTMKKTRIGFEWDEVKDYYIPFVQLLAKRYQLARFEQVRGVDYPVRFNYGVDSPDLEDFTLDQIVHDNLFLPEQGKEMLPYKVTKRGFATWEKIYTIGIRVNL